MKRLLRLGVTKPTRTPSYRSVLLCSKSIGLVRLEVHNKSRVEKFNAILSAIWCYSGGGGNLWGNGTKRRVSKPLIAIIP